MRTNPFIDAVYSTLKQKGTEKVSQEERNERLEKCNSCILSGVEKKWNGFRAKRGENGLMKMGNCKICGCVATLKTEYKNESCPLGKW